MREINISRLCLEEDPLGIIMNKECSENCALVLQLLLCIAYFFIFSGNIFKIKWLSVIEMK